MMPSFFAGQRDGRQSSLAALGDIGFKAECIATPRVICEPVPHYVCQQRRQGHASQRVPAPNPLPLPKKNPLPVKINVLPSRPPHFAPPGARVGGKDEHWIKEWVQ